jgi:hypothetical protein
VLRGAQRTAQAIVGVQPLVALEMMGNLRS